MTTYTTTDYLDWYDLFVNQLAGTPTIFLLLSFIVVAFIVIQLRSKNIVAMTIFGLWALIMSPYFPTVLPLTVFLIGSFFYWGIGRLVRE